MAVFTDQTGNSIELTTVPIRIISLVPSQTELLYKLGADTNVVGITKFCVHPQEWFRTKERVGGTKSVDIARIRSLQPDLIIANKEENSKTDVAQLATDFPVWTSDVSNLQQALDMIAGIGALTQQIENADAINKGIQQAFFQLPVAVTPVRAAYLIWQQPYMTVGGDTFISNMLTYSGCENIFADLHRYPVVTAADIRNRNCHVLLLSSEPFPFTQEHAEVLQLALPNVKIILVNGEFFSWYGSRLLLAPAYLASLAIDLAKVAGT